MSVILIIHRHVGKDHGLADEVHVLYAEPTELCEPEEAALYGDTIEETYANLVERLGRDYPVTQERYGMNCEPAAVFRANERHEILVVLKNKTGISGLHGLLCHASKWD